MRHKVTKAMIRALLQKGMRDIEENPKQGLRNLVDFGSYFAKGSVQKVFFAAIQRLLADPDCAFYRLIENAVRSVDHDILQTICVNVGYNSWRRGAQKISENNKAHGENVSWTILINLTAGKDDGLNVENVISQGQSKGIFTYMFQLNDQAKQLDLLFPVLQKHPECAFLLFVHPVICNQELAEKIAAAKNVIIALCSEHKEWMDAAEACKNKKCLFGVYSSYNDNTAPLILFGEWINEAIKYSGLIAFCIRDTSCSKETEMAVSRFIRRVRAGQKYPVFISDLHSDIEYVDQLIAAMP